jgi:sigma-E factor negative regulatory protein RseB
VTGLLHGVMRSFRARRQGMGSLLMSSALAVGLAGPVFGQQQEDYQDSGMALLRSMRDAARNLDYVGVYTYQQGAVMQSSRIVHIIDGTGERERIESLDGLAREFIRHNETTHRLIPEKKTIIVEQRRGDRFPAFLLGEADQIPQHYAIRIGKYPDRVAGRPCTVLELVPKDVYRYGYRICVDLEHAVLLKAQTLNRRQVINQIAFAMLDVGAKVAPEQLNSNWNTSGWKKQDALLSEVDLASEGWRISFPPGFHPLTQVTRSMSAGKEVDQLVLSDGLAAISIFIESFDPNRDNPFSKEVMHKGAMSIVRKRIGDHWFTALGEVPADTLREIAERTQYVPSSVN